MGNSIIKRNFAAGEVAPSIFGRADVVKYQSGLARCRNFMVRRHGGLSNRSGFQYITPQKTHSSTGRLWKFVFNADQTYVLLFENFSLRFVRSGALITVSGVAAYNGGTAYVLGDLASSGGVNYYCVAATTGNAPPNASYWYAMPAGDVYEIPTPFLTADLPALYFSQKNDVITITHNGYEIYELSRFGHTEWTLQGVTLSPSINPPGSLSVSGAGGSVSIWVATAVKSTTLEESIVSINAGASSVPTSGAPRTITIGAVSGAQEYNVYRHDGSGTYGFVGVATGTTFVDNGITPDYTVTPPGLPVDLTGTDDRPACNGYLQQRKCYGGKTNAPEEIYASKAGQYKNFSRSSPLQDDDACIWTPDGVEVNRIRHFVELSEYWVLTQGAEWILTGDGNGNLTPGTPGLKKRSSHGSAEIQPVIVGDSFLFVQARGSIVRDIKYEANSTGYQGRDLTIFSPHLFENYTLVHWDYAQIPNSIVWAARSDGHLIGLTYLREHEIWGWHDHDTYGYFEDVVVVPEGEEDMVYAIIKRTINGATVRYVERMSSRKISDIAVDATFMDSYLSYDGRHTGSTTMTLSGGTNWTFDEDLTLTASANTFTAGDVGKAVVLKIVTTTWTPEGGYATTTERVTSTITAYTNVTTVTVNANKTVPIAFRAVSITVWALAVTNVTGLAHLEGETVSILADGNVVTNGIDDPLTTVSGGTLSLDLENHAEIIHVGLPYVSDAQTLDLEVLGQETLADKKKQINQVTLLVESSRGIWAGEPNEDGTVNADHLYEHAQRTAEDEYDMIEGLTGKVVISMSASWNTGGRVHIRQRDPLPMSLLAVIPSVSVGG